jgi:hypothetical protein
MKYKKKTLAGGLIGGLTYALIQSLFDLMGNEAFDVNYFLFNFIFFGVGFGFFVNYHLRKNPKNKSINS